MCPRRRRRVGRGRRPSCEAVARAHALAPTGQPVCPYWTSRSLLLGNPFPPTGENACSYWGSRYFSTLELFNLKSAVDLRWICGGFAKREKAETDKIFQIRDGGSKKGTSAWIFPKRRGHTQTSAALLARRLHVLVPLETSQGLDPTNKGIDPIGREAVPNRRVSGA